MVADPALVAMLTQRYGAFVDPLAEEDSLAKFAVWVPPQSRLGNQYNFPLQGSLEHYDAGAELRKLAGVDEDDVYHVYPNFGPPHHTTLAQGW